MTLSFFNMNSMSLAFYFHYYLQYNCEQLEKQILRYACSIKIDKLAKFIDALKAEIWQKVIKIIV